MQLSDETVAGLSVCFSTAPFSAAKTLSVVCETTLALLTASDESGQEAVEGETSAACAAWMPAGLRVRAAAMSKKVDGVLLKQIVAALSSAFVEAAKLGADDASLRSALNDAGVSDEQFGVVCAAFKKHVDALRGVLARTEFGFSAVGDVDWRLDYVVKSDALDRANEPVYIVRLHLRADLDGAQRFVVCRLSPAASDAAKAKALAPPAAPPANHDYLEFACSRLQLQDLVAKLKDAVKQIERTGQQ